nr:MAG TPA_asm: hypothetical protein [Caudoviricetes sp.]
MSTFNTTKLTNDRVLVTGTNDAGEACSTMLDSSQLKRLAQEQDVILAGQRFDRSIEDFFAPLTEAAEKYSAAAAPAPVDPAFLYVIDEGREGVEEIEPHIHELDHDSAVLRMIFTEDTSRLIWVKTPQYDSIEMLEYEPKEDPAPQEVSLEDFFGLVFGESFTEAADEEDEEASDPGISVQVAEGLAEDQPEVPLEGLAKEAFDADAE